ncbi:MAG: molybdopterin-dependent oxidoreductase [Dehalococcoidales bacterium]|jgi:DMSO/TMAO reductase YedYZ molybdopterin-dependent catalytic subunit
MRKSSIVMSVIAVFIIIATGIGATACTPGSETTQLSGVEVREYQGEDLSAVSSFRENSIKGTQHVDISTYQLQVNGLVANSENLTYNDVTNNFTDYKKVVRLNCVEGWSVNILWEGVQVRDIINQAGALPEAKVVIFHAVDGYTTSFPIEYIMDNPILMAYKMNDITIPAERGYPFMLVAEMKWGYKWIKWIDQIELSDNISYKGYWEERGYSNGGDLDKGFFDNSDIFPF